MASVHVPAPTHSAQHARRTSASVHAGPRPRATAQAGGQVSSSGSARTRASTSSTKAVRVLQKNYAPTEQDETVQPSGPYCSVPSTELRRAPLLRRLLCYCGIACPVEYAYEAPRQWAARGLVAEDNTTSGLAPEVERLAYFTDGPGSPIDQSVAQGPFSWWRYQGPGL
jgi:hypothetical protein